MYKRTFSLFVVFSLVLALFAAAQTSGTVSAQGEKYPFARTACKEDLKGKEITYYTFGDLSGAYRAITLPLVAGLTDAIAYFNEQGGVCGATIKLKSDDTAGKPETVQALYQQYRAFQPKPLLLGLYGSADSELLRDKVAEDTIPVFLFAGSTKGLYGEKGDTPGWIFAGIPLYADQFGAFCQYIGKAWTTELKRSGTPKIAHLSWEGAFGRSSETPESTAFCKTQGVEVVGSEYFLPTATDVTAQIQKLTGAGANILFTTSLGTGAALIAKDLTTLGKEKDVLLAGVNWVLDTSVGLLGAANINPRTGFPSTDGFMGPLPYGWWDEGTTSTKFVEALWVKNKRNADPSTRNVAYQAGFASIDFFIEVVTQTVNRVGFAKLDGSAVYETLTKFKFESLGGLFRFDYSGGVRTQNLTRIGVLTYAKDKDGKPVIVEAGGRKFPVTVIMPVTKDYVPVPDLRPGKAGVAATPAATQAK